MHNIPLRSKGITFSASVSSSVAYRSMCAPHNTCVPFSSRATNRILGKALEPRLEPGRPKALSFSVVSATSNVLPSKLTNRHCRYQAPLVRFSANGSYHRVIQLLQRRGAQSAARLRNAGLTGYLHLGGRIEQPLHAFQQATQYFTIGGPHIQRQRNDVIDHHMRRQIALADASALGLLQNLMDFLDGEELGNHAEANVVSDPAASRQLRQSACHGLSLAMAPGRSFGISWNVIKIGD